MRVLGIDLALACTGVALVDGGFRTIKPKSSSAGYRRHWDVAEELLGIVLEEKPDVIVLEDYAPHAPGVDSLIRSAEVGGIVRAMLERHGQAFALVRPSSLKAFATGRGTATKDEVLEAALHRIRFVDPELRPANHDEADAYWLRLIGEWRALPAGTELGLDPKRLAALDAVVWPDLELAR